MPKIAVIIFAVVFYCQGAMYSQGKETTKKNFTFFMEKALEDAIYEQNIQLKLAEDEIDFWKDQRNYERALKKKSYTAYQVYVNTKLEAYDNHRLECKSPHQHSDHYFLQAAFYSEQGKKVKINDNSTAQNSQRH
jgi:hypothetical protein